MTRIGPLARLILVAVALVAAVVVTRCAPPSEGSSAATVEPATTSSSVPVEPTPTTSQRNSSAVEPWEKTARSFANRYGNTKGGRSSWLKRLRPLVSDRVYASLKTIRLENLPTGSVGAGEVHSRAEVGGVMRFPLRGGSIAGIDVTVSATDQGTLRVTDFAPVTDREVS